MVSQETLSGLRTQSAPTRPARSPNGAGRGRCGGGSAARPEIAGERAHHRGFERLLGFERRQDAGQARAASIDLPEPGGPIISRL